MKKTISIIFLTLFCISQIYSDDVEDNYYKRIKSENVMESYLQYLKEYPNGSYISQVLGSIATLKTNEQLMFFQENILKDIPQGLITKKVLINNAAGNDLLHVLFLILNNENYKNINIQINNRNKIIVKYDEGDVKEITIEMNLENNYWKFVVLTLNGNTYKNKDVESYLIMQTTENTMRAYKKIYLNYE